MLNTMPELPIDPPPEVEVPTEMMVANSAVKALYWAADQFRDNHNLTAGEVTAMKDFLAGVENLLEVADKENS
ncbi:hypothetical protein LCGC14_0893020 [marine sediment metagenome]|uniref:Uncharacterized protein n=1 Tax=marine sediment metagenome TaxID=412755 RepID=A0A0F9S5M5_9ZZZZ